MSYVDILRDGFEERAASDEAFDRAIRSVAGDVLGGTDVLEAGLRLCDIVCQTFRRPSPISVGMLVATMRRFTQATFFTVEVGVCPQPDRELERNKLALSALSEPFTASLWCGNREPDGRLEWDGILEHEIPLGWKPLLNSLPLEVGYCQPEVLYFHLLRSGGFARWPYEHESIYGFVVADSEWAAWRRERYRRNLWMSPWHENAA